MCNVQYQNVIVYQKMTCGSLVSYDMIPTTRARHRKSGKREVPYDLWKFHANLFADRVSYGNFQYPPKYFQRDDKSYYLMSLQIFNSDTIHENRKALNCSSRKSKILWTYLMT